MTVSFFFNSDNLNLRLFLFLYSYFSSSYYYYTTIIYPSALESPYLRGLEIGTFHILS